MKGPVLALVLVPAAAWAQALAPQALNSFTVVPSAIMSAQVETPKGQVIGRVVRVVRDAAGKPSALEVLSAQGTLTVPAVSASYDQSRNLVVAEIPGAQIAKRGR